MGELLVIEMIARYPLVKGISRTQNELIVDFLKTNYGKNIRVYCSVQFEKEAIKEKVLFAGKCIGKDYHPEEIKKKIGELVKMAESDLSAGLIKSPWKLKSKVRSKFTLRIEYSVVSEGC